MNLIEELGMVFLSICYGLDFRFVLPKNRVRKTSTTSGSAWLGMDMRRPHSSAMSAIDRFFCHSPMKAALPVDSFVGWGKITELV
jgi:hypothetical protein